MAIKLLLLGTQSVVTFSLQDLILTADQTIKSMGCCDLSEVNRCLSPLAPDVALVVDPTSERWIAAVEGIRYRTPPQKVAVVLGQALPTRVRYAMSLGVHGLFSIQSTADQFLEGLRRIAAGRRYVTPQFADMATETLEDTKANPHATLLLTARERQVLLAIGEGRTTQETASILGLSVYTIDSHRRNIMEKLGLHNVAAMVQFAVALSRTRTEVDVVRENPGMSGLETTCSSSLGM